MCLCCCFSQLAAINNSTTAPSLRSESLRDLGRFAVQNSLSVLPSRPRCASGSSVPLQVTRGASRSLRPPRAGDRFAGGDCVLGTCPKGQGSSRCSARSYRRDKDTIPAPSWGREAGLRPHRAFLPPVAYGSARGKKLDGSPTGLLPGPGRAPPLCYRWPPVRCAPNCGQR